MRSTLEWKTRESEYKILNCITNEKLYPFGLVASPMCTFCRETAESIEHLLFSCKISFSSQDTPAGKEFSEPPTGVDALTIELWETRGEQSIYHLLTFIISTCWALQYGRTHATHIRTIARATFSATKISKSSILIVAHAWSLIFLNSFKNPSQYCWKTPGRGGGYFLQWPIRDPEVSQIEVYKREFHNVN